MHNNEATRRKCPSRRWGRIIIPPLGRCCQPSQRHAIQRQDSLFVVPVKNLSISTCKLSWTHRFFWSLAAASLFPDSAVSEVAAGDLLRSCLLKTDEGMAWKVVYSSRFPQPQGDRPPHSLRVVSAVIMHGEFPGRAIHFLHTCIWACHVSRESTCKTAKFVTK